LTPEKPRRAERPKREDPKGEAGRAGGEEGERREKMAGAREGEGDPDLPPGWKLYLSSQKVPFYYNHTTGERTWHKPGTPGTPKKGKSISARFFFFFLSA
jgi:hypothetical protein